MAYTIKYFSFAGIESKFRVTEKIRTIIKYHNIYIEKIFEDELSTYPEENEEILFTNIAKCCVKYGRLSLLEILLNKYSYDINFEDGILILMSVHNRWQYITNFLLRKNINIDNCLDKLFLIACQNFDTDLLQLLITKGCDINYDDGFLLSEACAKAKLLFVEYLIKNGMDPNYTDHNSYTPCYYALKNGHLDIVKYLFSVGANIHNKNFLKIAIEKNYYDIVKFLLENGANPSGDFCPLLLSIYTNNYDITKLLLEYGADISVIRNAEIDVNQYDWEMVELLLDKNIDPIQIIRIMLSNKKIENTKGNILGYI